MNPLELLFFLQKAKKFKDRKKEEKYMMKKGRKRRSISLRKKERGEVQGSERKNGGRSISFIKEERGEV